VVSGQWSAISDQWSVVSGQWSVISSQWPVLSDLEHTLFEMIATDISGSVEDFRVLTTDH
jgi:hypothetical protein